MRIANSAFTTAAFATSSILGSGLSVLYHGAGLLGIWRLSNGTVQLAKDRDIATVAICLVAFAFSELLSVIVNWRGLNGLVKLDSVLAFLLFLPVHSRLRLSPPEQIWKAATVGAAIACVGGMMISLVEWTVSGLSARVEGGTGNSAIFANTLAIAVPLALAGAAGRNRKQVFLMIGAAAAGFVALFSASARALLVAGALNVAITAIYLYRHSDLSIRPKVIIAAVLVMAVAIFLVVPAFSVRVAGTLDEIMRIMDGARHGSLGERLRIWEGALRLWADQPWFGFGPDSVPEVFGKMNLLDPNGHLISYSHYHNVLITALMRGGIVEAVSVTAVLTIPLAMTFFPKFAPLTAEGRLLVRVAMISFIFAGTGGVVLVTTSSIAYFVFRL